METLETELAPKARASFRLGRERFEQKLKLEEGLGLSADRLLAIAERELATTEDAFRSAASKLNGGDPAEAWAKAKSAAPRARESSSKPPSSSLASCSRSSRSRSC